MQSDTQISNADDYFTGLPKLFKLADLKGKAGACFTKEEKLQIRMEKEKEKMRKCNENLDRISEEMKDVNQPSMSKRALKLKMDEMETLFREERASRRAQELQMAELMHELQSQRQYAANARGFYESEDYQRFMRADPRQFQNSHGPEQFQTETHYNQHIQQVDDH